MFRKLFFFKFLPGKMDLALLTVRLFVPLSILVKHGLEKIFHYPAMFVRLTGNHHYVAALGVGPSLFCAAIADGILTVLLIFGIATRWCALLCFINIAVAWRMVLHFPYFASHSSPHAVILSGYQGELMILYLAAMLGLMIAGGGKYSIDWLLERE
jgi:putative oxidoreductase